MDVHSQNKQQKRIVLFGSSGWRAQHVRYSEPHHKNIGFCGRSLSHSSWRGGLSQWFSLTMRSLFATCWMVGHTFSRLLHRISVWWPSTKFVADNAQRTWFKRWYMCVGASFCKGFDSNALSARKLGVLLLLVPVFAFKGSPCPVEKKESNWMLMKLWVLRLDWGSLKYLV